MSSQAAAQEEKAVIEYVAKDSTKIKLTPSIIKRYLVSGRAEYVTEQELFVYMGLCKSRGLNPFIRDCFLVKYTQNESAAIVTSIDYYRKRARAQSDCKGWKVGIVILGKDGDLVYRNGCILLEGEKLVGGWAEAIPEGWKEPMRKEVNLARYIKRKSDGSITRFWSPDNQPEMIAKVAESQLLRALWPDEFGGMYVDSEVQSRDAQEELNTAVSTIDPNQAEKESAAENAAQEVVSKFASVFAEEIKHPLWQACVDDIIATYGATQGITKENYKARFLELAAQIKAGFPEFVKYRDASPGNDDKDPNEPDSGKASVDPVAAFREEWIRLKPAGFANYVRGNLDRFKTAAQQLKAEAWQKWVKFYPGEPWPVTEAQNDVQRNAGTNGWTSPAAGSELATQTGSPDVAPESGTGTQSAADLQRLKVIDELKGFPEPVMRQAKQRMGFSISPGTWPPTLEGCARLLDMANSIEDEQRK